MPGRILVVEDDRVVAGAIREYLKAGGYGCTCVRTDRAAYATLPTLPAIAAIIVDINLGVGTTGFDVARFARRVFPKLGVIYVTGGGSPDLKAFGVPDSVFIRKPFTADELLSQLRSFLAQPCG